MVPVFSLINDKASIPSKQGSFYSFKATNELIAIGGAGATITYCTGVSVDIPKGYVAFLLPAEDIDKTTLVMQEGFKILTGRVDEVHITFKGLLNKNKKFNINDNVARLVIMPNGEEK